MLRAYEVPTNEPLIRLHPRHYSSSRTFELSPRNWTSSEFGQFLSSRVAPAEISGYACCHREWQDMLKSPPCRCCWCWKASVLPKTDPPLSPTRMQIQIKAEVLPSRYSQIVSDSKLQITYLTLRSYLIFVV